jgi:hypothetical protein
LGVVDLIDERSGTVLCALSPLDKTANVNSLRRRLEPRLEENPEALAGNAGMAPLLRKLMADYAATGLPPAYLPMPSEPEQGT